MSTKVRMRCARCGKSFKSSAKQTLCPDCDAKERRARAAAKTAPAKPAVSAPGSARQPKIVGPGAGILVPGLAQPSAPLLAYEQPQREQSAAQVAGERADRLEREQRHNGAERPRTDQPGHAQAASKGDGRAQQERQQKPTPPRPPREPKPRREPTPPFTLTDELRTRIETRYLELAQPVEFDGIRTRITTELGLPKAAVKKAVLELRQRMKMPSWWELQAYKGSDQDLERIRRAYVGYLPIPPVGVHKQLAEELGLEPLAVYQGIRRIRAEMHLPQYNPPELHQRTSAATPESTQGAVGEDGSLTPNTKGAEPQQTGADITTPMAEVS